MTRLVIDNLGPIRHADLTFGDLTVFVGPQATGKSIALQTLRLIIDSGYIVSELKRHGLDWSNKTTEFLDVYFGEGMSALWREGDSQIAHGGKSFDIAKSTSSRPKRGMTPEPRLFYIPAQRVLTLRGGWPRPFTDYSPGDPFAVREFSERLRGLMELEFSKIDAILFPRNQRLTKDIRQLVQSAFFHDFKLKVARQGAQKRLVLHRDDASPQLPFMVWSAGQREFVPLLLGLYWLMPAGSVSRRDKIEWVIIEEPEMGLHPKAIGALLLIVLELLRRGYRVCLSTHSPQVLDLVWALSLLSKHQAKPGEVLDLFAVRHSTKLMEIATIALNKSSRVYFFDPKGMTHDISALDPGSTDEFESTWGGLGWFSGRVADVVANVVAASERREDP